MEDEQRKDENGEFLVLICEGKKFHVRKTDLFTQSKRTYEMSEDSLFIVNKMIDYVNNGDYDVSAVPKIEEQNISALQFHARMFPLADKYAVDILISLSAAKYLDRLRNSEIVEFLGSIPAYARINLLQGLGNTPARQIYEGIVGTTPEFIKELLDSYMETPMIGKCWDCGSYRALQGVQSRCLQCGHDTTPTTC
ncbi:uncharacterized protein BKA55DRAFT_587578 [Fusarium redolens]|uniref:BTB domain-containing protein n=1 Tax=Fusarium redolens TaxID=48865 RepID=A0A9P9FVV7_FUSRE|nr:uncharacterized protein BKA55DRAFT_587578 [Fusarium redolens]KAH7202890.1 hypothetical protein BKA55DRAFT_587578 [Fusarium redolens]